MYKFNKNIIVIAVCVHVNNGNNKKVLYIHKLSAIVDIIKKYVNSLKKSLIIHLKNLHLISV